MLDDSGCVGPNGLLCSVTLVRVETGWALVDALISTMGASFVEPILPTLLGFWKSTFSIGGVCDALRACVMYDCIVCSHALCTPHVQCALLVCSHPSQPQVASEKEIAVFCRTRADGLASICSFATYCPSLVKPKVLAQILPFLAATLYPPSPLQLTDKLEI